MEKGKLFKIMILGAVLVLMGCGENSSNNSTNNSNRITLPNGFINPNQNGSGVIDTSSSILTPLGNLHPSWQRDYSRVELELDIGTVLGTHNTLDANQGGTLVLHGVDRGTGGSFFSAFTSGGNTINDVKENYWSYNSLGKLVWRGVFEGPSGSLVVVVDGVFQAGDGGDPFDQMSGSIWFRPWPIVDDRGFTRELRGFADPLLIEGEGCYYRNGVFDCKNPSSPPARCWDVSEGPYDCRFSVSDDSKVITTIGNAYTVGEYTKMAEFTGLSRDRTFKETF